MRFPHAHSDHHGHHGHGHHFPHHHMAARHPHGPFGDDAELPGADRAGRRGGGRPGPGRMFGHGDLKLLLLALIETQPRHGYELIRAIEELCGGTYTPSPGAIYPTLTFLEEAGYAAIHASADSAKKQYAITAEGRAFLDQNRVDVEAVMQRLKLASRMMAKLNVPAEVREAMHRLKATLIGHDRSWDAAEIARVVAIVERAAADISAQAAS